MLTFWPAVVLLSSYLFSPAQTTGGDVTLEIRPIAAVNALEEEIPVEIVVTLGDGFPTEEARGTVTIDVIDTWRIVGDATRPFVVRRGEAATLRFTVVAGKGTYAAHYPIHARATVGDRKIATVLVVEVTREAVAAANSATTELPTLRLIAPGRVDLLDLTTAQISFRVGESGSIVTRRVGWSGDDPTTGAFAQRQNVTRGDRRTALAFHPPWRKGWGTVWADWSVELPRAEPLFFDFATAIRDNDPQTEPPSDGVRFQVWVQPEGEEFSLLFDRFSAAKRWEEARVDLGAYAGKRVRLRLVTDPGPSHDTTCDLAYWADPALFAGIMPEGAKPIDADRLTEAKEKAERLLAGETTDEGWRLTDDAAIALLLGRLGPLDAAIGVATSDGALAFDGFIVEIDGRRLGEWRSGFLLGELRRDGDEWTLPIRDGERRYALVMRVWPEKTGLRFRFALDDVDRGADGRPRITRIALGPVDTAVRRLYAGHGNVLEEPGSLRLVYNGFNLSTSFVGFDFVNGVSLLEATDIPPDALIHDPEQRLATLEAHHDLTWTLVPSAGGAFDAAWRYRAILHPTPPPSFDRIRGRMVLDQWGGDYAEAAKGLERAARYGLTHSVFVKHVWQRWGYDYRLPDIYPPAGNWDDFLAMVEAARRNGILFAPHDNYIDFYPDAPGFSYRYVIFNEDGTPQRAWYNRGRDAQSYRWLSHAFGPWRDENFRKIADGFAPTSYFIDVFSAITPNDYRDESGHFYSKMESVRRWSETFDRAREVFGNAPMISEAGHDALLGHLDAAEADHIGWKPPESKARSWSWKVPAKDGERVPWHDMVTHGAFALLAGGLGPRYRGDGSRELHGYGSDDYLTMTVLGGRNPMSDGPFNRTAVMTYWLLHDLNNALASREMTAHRFADDDIHRQIVRFGDDAEVIANRGKSDWAVEGHVLPPYGFFARAGATRAAIERKEGVIVSWSEGPESRFVDARPPEQFGGVPIRVTVVGVETLGGRRFRLHMRWTVDRPVTESGKPYLHFTNADVAPEGEHIAFQGGIPITSDLWARAGTYDVFVEATLPEGMPPGVYGIRYGIYQPEKRGRRWRLQGPRDATGRHDGGTLLFAENPDGSLTVRHEPPPEDRIADRVNTERKVVAFGPIKTNGAFRLLPKERLIVPLPESEPFRVILDMRGLGLFPTVRRVEALREDGTSDGDMQFDLDDGVLMFTTRGDDFAYRLGY